MFFPVLGSIGSCHGGVLVLCLFCGGGGPLQCSSVHWTYSVVVLISQKAGFVLTFGLICYIFHNQVFSLSLVLTQVFVSLLL